MTIGHITATTLEQTLVSTCKQIDVIEPYLCNGIGKVAHEGAEAIIDVILMPLLLQRAAAPMDWSGIGSSVIGSLTGAYLTEQATEMTLHNHDSHAHHHFDLGKLVTTTAIGIGASLALPHAVGIFTGAALIAGVTTVTGSIYDYATCEE